MAELPNSSATSVPSAVHLLDSALGRPIRSWQFTDKQLISIGRADDCDVQISDPYVSRSHAELQAADGQWKLISRGRYGILVQGETITELTIAGETTFRLGAAGPTLRFNPVAPLISNPVVQETDNRMTMMFDSTLVQNLFELDHKKLEREVSEIADADYFQQLQHRAQQLREKRT
jgi:pSer/pThr/pTyr-binding forkhead associated (FHA) protein